MTMADPEALRTQLLPTLSDGSLEVAAADYSLAELQGYLSELDLAALPLRAGESLKSAWIATELNRVAIGIVGIDVQRGKEIAGQLGPMAVVVPEEAGTNGGLYACTANGCGTRGGVKIVNAPIAGCTSAFLVRRTDTGARYMLTAGHCVDWANDGNWTNGDGSITWGAGANFEFQSASGHTITNDLGVFKMGNATPSVRNQYMYAQVPCFRGVRTGAATPTRTSTRSHGASSGLPASGPSRPAPRRRAEMMRRRPLPLALIAICLAVTGCSLLTAVRLPVLEDWDPGDSCIGAGFDLRVDGSATDIRLTWAVTRDGKRIELAWPRGYTARFSPGLEVLDERGALVARAGDTLASGCPVGTGSDLTMIKVTAGDVRPTESASP